MFGGSRTWSLAAIAEIARCHYSMPPTFLNGIDKMRVLEEGAVGGLVRHYYGSWVKYPLYFAQSPLKIMFSLPAADKMKAQ